MFFPLPTGIRKVWISGVTQYAKRGSGVEVGTYLVRVFKRAILWVCNIPFAEVKGEQYDSEKLKRSGMFSLKLPGKELESRPAVARPRRPNDVCSSSGLHEVAYQSAGSVELTSGETADGAGRAGWQISY